MRLAYIISAYQLPEQVVRLVQRLDSGRASFLIHVDRKADKGVFAQIAALGARPHIQLLPRHTCYWGGFGHVRATLAGIEALISGEIAFDYAVLLTGQDYPLKPNGAIEARFATARGALFMEHFRLPSDHWEHGGMDRIERWHFRAVGRYVVFPPRYPSLLRRRFPVGLTPYGGSSYWCLTRDCIAYIWQFVRRHPAIVRFFACAEVPDELFFQTIVMNSPFADAVVNDNLRHIDWKAPNGPSPAIMRCDDLECLARSPALFARKFDQRVDPVVLDMIDQELLQVSPASPHAPAERQRYAWLAEKGYSCE
jgi:hypothetical protein